MKCKWIKGLNGEMGDLIYNMDGMGWGKDLGFSRGGGVVGSRGSTKSLYLRYIGYVPVL